MRSKDGLKKMNMKDKFKHYLEKRKFKKQLRKTKWKLFKEIWYWKPYDHCYFHNLTMAQIQGLYDYYKAGNNVWQSKESAARIIRSLEHILEVNKTLTSSLDMEDIDINTFPSIEEMRERDAKETEMYQEIYTSIGKNIQDWWD